MMIVGMKMLNYSATESIDEEDDEEETTKKTSAMEKFLMAASFGLSIVFAFGLSLFLFKFLPLWITDYFSGVFTILNETISKIEYGNVKINGDLSFTIL